MNKLWYFSNEDILPMMEKIKKRVKKNFALLKNFLNLKLLELLQYEAHEIPRYKRPENQPAAVGYATRTSLVKIEQTFCI